MRWFPKDWAGQVSDFVLLNPKTYSKLIKRQHPIGIISYTGIVFIVWLLTLDPLVFVSIPIIAIYALVYALFIHMGVKSELRKPGSYVLTVDNTLLAFSLSLVVLAAASYPLLVIFNYFEGADHFPFIVFSMLGSFFFNCNMRLVLMTYSDAEPDHLFGASLVPFVIVCFAIYFL